MTSRFGSFLIAALVCGTPTTALAQDAPPPEPDKPDVVVTGSFFTRYELRHNYSELAGPRPGRFAEFDAFAYRARLGLATTPIDLGKGRTVVVSMTPQASGFWGTVSGGLADAAAGIHTASLKIKGDKNWAEVGRFEMAYGDHLVIGNVGWHQTGRSFDGARTRIAIGSSGAWIDGFVTQTAEAQGGAGTGFGDGDGVFLGAYAALGPNVAEGMELDAYVLSDITPQTSDDTDAMAEVYDAVEVTVGTRVKKPVGTITLHGEAGVQFGKRAASANEGVFAFQVDGGAWFKTGDKAKVGAAAFFASGDDADTDTIESWNQLYPTGHKFLGFMDVVFARSNVVGGTVKVRFTASDDLNLAADAHVFARPQTPDGVDGYTGAEADLWGLYKLGKGLGLRGQYAVFLPNDSGPFGTDSVIHYFEVQFKYDLK